MCATGRVRKGWGVEEATGTVARRRRKEEEGSGAARAVPGLIARAGRWASTGWCGRIRGSISGWL